MSEKVSLEEMLAVLRTDIEYEQIMDRLRGEMGCVLDATEKRRLQVKQRMLETLTLIRAHETDFRAWLRGRLRTGRTDSTGPGRSVTSSPAPTA